MKAPELRELSPGREWRCATLAEHECSGVPVGALGAVPVCESGAWAEHAERLTEEARQARMMAEPAFREMLRREAAEEAAWERRHS